MGTRAKIGERTASVKAGESPKKVTEVAANVRFVDGEEGVRSMDFFRAVS